MYKSMLVSQWLFRDWHDFFVHLVITPMLSQIVDTLPLVEWKLKRRQQMMEIAVRPCNSPCEEDK